MHTPHWTIRVTAMQEHIITGEPNEIILFNRDKALQRFFEICEKHDLEPTRSDKGNISYYEGGGRGHDLRVELEVTNFLN